MRFIDTKEQDIIPRRDQVWELAALAERMIIALEKEGLSASKNLRAIAAGTAVNTAPEQIALAQYCFWTGEMQMGQIEGVLTTEAGFLHGREVTLTTYDPTVISISEVVKLAKKVDCADAVYPKTQQQLTELKRSGHSAMHLMDNSYRAAPASDQKKQMQGTTYSKIKLTPEQATKINAFIRSDPGRANSYLSEAQQKALRSR